MWTSQPPAVGSSDWLDLLSSRSDEYSARIFPSTIDALDYVVGGAFTSFSRNVVKVDFIPVDDVDLQGLCATWYICSNSRTNTSDRYVVSSACDRRAANSDARCHCTSASCYQCHDKRTHRSNENKIRCDERHRGL